MCSWFMCHTFVSQVLLKMPFPGCPWLQGFAAAERGEQPSSWLQANDPWFCTSNRQQCALKDFTLSILVEKGLHVFVVVAWRFCECSVCLVGVFLLVFFFFSCLFVGGFFVVQASYQHINFLYQAFISPNRESLALPIGFANARPHSALGTITKQLMCPLFLVQSVDSCTNTLCFYNFIPILHF